MPKTDGSVFRTRLSPSGAPVHVMREDAYARSLDAAAKVIRKIDQRRASEKIVLHDINYDFQS